MIGYRAAQYPSPSASSWILFGVSFLARRRVMCAVRNNPCPPAADNPGARFVTHSFKTARHGFSFNSRLKNVIHSADKLKFPRLCRHSVGVIFVVAVGC